MKIVCQERVNELRLEWKSAGWCIQLSHQGSALAALGWQCDYGTSANALFGVVDVAGKVRAS
jgi:hypothetical protein